MLNFLGHLTNPSSRITLTSVFIKNQFLMNKNYSFSRTTWLKLGLLPLLAMLFAVRANAVVVGNYAFAQTSGTYTPITGGTVLNSGTTIDDQTYAVTLPSAFVYDGVSFTTVYVNANTYLALGGASGVTGYTPLSTTNTGRYLISGLAWDSNAQDATAEIRWELVGNEIVFQWKNLKRFSGGAGDSFNTQIRLNICTGTVSIVYGTFTSGTATSGAQVGIRGNSNAFATNILNRLVNTTAGTNTWNPTSAGTTATSSCVVTSAILPTSGATLTWTPNATAFPACAAPSGTAVTANTGTSVSFSVASNPCGAPFQYNWEVVPQGNAQGVGVVTSGNSSTTSFTASGLTSLTNYTLYVRAECSAGTTYSTYTSFNFQAACAGVPNTPVANVSNATPCLNGAASNFTVTGASTGAGFTYQWQESDDDGATDPWSNVTTGTGGTTVAYSTAAFSTTGRYYRLRTTCSNTPGSPSFSNSVLLTGTVGGTCSPAYSVTRTTGVTFNQIFGTGTNYTGWIANGTTDGDDNTTTLQNIGFTFNYFGVDYTQFAASMNGFISLGTTLTTTGHFLNTIGTNTTVRNRVIAPMWDDLCVPGQVYANRNYMSYKLEGTPGSQILTIEWAGMERFSIPGPNMNFQVKLYEGSNNIEFVYGSMTGVNGTFNSAYGYSSGINGAGTAAVSGASLLCQQSLNTNLFGGTAVDNMLVVPECYTSVLFTNGGTLSGGSPLPAVTNDEPAGAVAIATGIAPPAEYCGFYRSATATASAGITAPCAGTPDDDVWFTFFNPTTQDIRVSVVSEATYNAVIQCFSDLGVTSVGCSNAGTAGLIENLTMTALPAGQYWVRVFDSGTGAAGAGHFHISAFNPPPVPTNDECAGAFNIVPGITCDAPVSGTTTTLGATASANTPQPTTADDDVWYKFTATTTAVELQVQSGPAFNAVFQLYDGGVAPGTCATAMTAVGGNINNTGTLGLETNTYNGLTIGNTYFVRVWHNLIGSGNGGFTICARAICQDVSAVTATADNVALDVDFAWTGGTADLYYGAAPLTAPTGATTPTAASVTSPQTVAALTADTQYQVYVRSNCGGGLVGNWVGPVAYDTYCPALTAFSVTANVATLEATSTWTGGNGDLYYGPTGVTPPTGSTTPSVSNVASGYVITGLTPGTIYDLYFRSNCGGSQGLWSTVRNFNTYTLVPSSGNATITSCDAVIADHAGPSANYSASVDGYLVINATSPTAYMGIQGTFDVEAGFDYVRVYEGVGTGGTLLFQSSTGFSSPDQGTFAVYSPTAGGSLTIRFSSDSSVNLPGFTATVQCSDCAPVTAITAVGDAFNMDADITWTGGAADLYYGAAPLTAPTGATTPTVSNVTSVYNITGLTAATNYTAYIRSNCGASQGFWQGPFNFNTTCPALVGTPSVVTNPTAGTGVINWTSGVADFFYGVGISAPTGSTTPTLASASPGAAISGLIPSQNYTLYYRSNCSGNYGAWVGPVAFNTFITVPASGTNTLTLCNATIYDSGGPNGNYQNNETGYLTIYPPSGKVFNISITVPGGGLEPGFDFLVLYEGVDNTGPIWGAANAAGTYTQLTSSVAGGPVTIATESDGSVTGTGYSITVACVDPPPCPNLTPFTASAYGAGFQAPYSCGAGCTSATVQVEYGAPGFTQGTGTTVTTTANPAIVTGLTPLTAYQYYIRRDCTGTGDGYAEWAGPFNVTTSFENDVCIGAETVTCGSTISATTVGSSNDQMPDQCGAATGTQTAGGIWYVLSGNNQEVTVTVANFDSRISVYTGTCGNLSCITGNDDDNVSEPFGLGSTVTFNSIAGNDYYIMVHGFGSSTGAFDMTVTCNPLCSPQQANDLCSGATALNIQSPFNTAYVSGNTTCASAGPNANLGFACGGTFSIYKDLWYTFDSDELSSVILSMNSGAGAGATGTYYYALYTGTCNSLTYANVCGSFTVGNPIGVAVTPQTNYFLRIYSSNTATFTTGTFDLAVVEPYTNDLRANALALTPRSYPTCISSNVVSQNLDLATPGAGALGGAAPAGAGQDLWYRFTAQTNACRISATSANDTYIELQNSAGTTLLESENDGINSILLNDALTVGQQYYVLVRNQDGTNGGAPTTVCIQYLGASVCNNVSSNFTSLCSGFKASYTGANSYTGNFTEVPTGGDPVADTFVFSTSGGSTTIPMSSVSGMQYGRSYDVLINASYNLADAASNAETIVVNGITPCTITIAPHAELNLRASDSQPNQRFLNSTVGATAWICGASYYKWEFTQLTPTVGVATTFDGPAGNRFLSLASVNANTPGFLVPGATYQIRIAPVFGTVVGTFGTVDQVLQIAGSAMPIVEGEELENIEARNEEFMGEEVALYPNPNNGTAVNLNVYGVDTDKMQVRILDGMGRVVYTNQFVVEGSLNTIVSFEKPLASGLYMVEFIYNGKTETQRMMVQK